MCMRVKETTSSSTVLECHHWAVRHIWGGGRNVTTGPGRPTTHLDTPNALNVSIYNRMTRQTHLHSQCRHTTLIIMSYPNYNSGWTAYVECIGSPLSWFVLTKWTLLKTRYPKHFNEKKKQDNSSSLRGKKHMLHFWCLILYSGFTHTHTPLTLWHSVVIQLVPYQRRLELWAEEPIPVSAVAKHQEMKGKDSHVDDNWPQNQAKCSSQKVLGNHFLQERIQYMNTYVSTGW